MARAGAASSTAAWFTTRANAARTSALLLCHPLHIDREVGLTKSKARDANRYAWSMSATHHSSRDLAR